MNVASINLAGLLATIFVALGVAKVLAVPRMREAAVHVGFSTTAYWGIGLLEVAGAAGLLIGLTTPALGTVASAGLLVLLAGAVIAHVRNRDEPRDIAPAALAVILVAAQLGLHLAAA